MPAPLKLTRATIERVRRDHAAGKTIAKIRAENKISVGTLYKIVKGEYDAAPRPAGKQRRYDAGGRRRSTLIARIWKTADRQVREIEARLAAGKQKPTERERDARALAALVRTLRDLNAFDETHAGAATDQQANEPQSIDIDEFRNELARRIHAFVDARTGDGVPAAAQGVGDGDRE